MRITESADLPASPDEVFATRATEEFQEEKCERSSSAEHTVAISQAAGRTVITTTRAMPTESLPDAVRSAVGEHLMIHETQDWGPANPDGSRFARIDIKVQGAPVTLQGTLRLTPTDTGSHQSLEAELKASIPFLGGKVERAAAPAIKHGFDLEAQILNEWLTE